MADRSVTYEFRAKFDSFKASLAAGGKSVDDFGKKLTALDAQGEKARAGLTHFGDVGGKIALGATAGLAAITLVTANFEKAMSGVAAATGEGEAGMNALREAALQAGADTAFSASEAAAGIEALAKAGVATQDILGGGLQGALDLAAAGQIDVAVAAETAASAMTQFGLAGEDVPHIADLLAAAAGKAQGEVTDMAAALNQSGLIADQVGLSIEETAGGLAAFASAGLLGSDAGTSFKTMLGSLTPNSAKAATAMEELGISAYDSQGNFIGLAEFAGNLQEGLAGLTDQQRQATLETIFGSDAVRAASILYEQGAGGIQTWIDKTDDAGFAAETAATKLDNLAGDWEALTGSIETALIGMGSDSQGPLRSLVQGLTDTVNAFGDLPGPVQNATTALIGLAAILGASVFVGSRIASGMAATTTALTNMGMSAESASRSVRLMGRAMGAAAGVGLFAVGMSNANESLGSFMATIGGAAAGGSVFGPWGAAIGGAVGLFASLAHNADDASGAVDTFTQALDQQTGALTENNRQLAQKQLQDSGAFDAAEQLGIDLALVTDAALGNADALQAVIDATSGYGAVVRSVGGSKGSFSAGYSEDAQAAATLQEELGNVNDVVQQSTNKFNQNKEAAGDAAGGIDNASGAAATAAPQFEKMSDAMKASRESARGIARQFVGLGDSLDNAKVSLSQWIKQLADQADALRNFRVNAQKAAKQGLNEGLIKSLHEAGPAGAMRMRQLANATDAEIKRANRAWRSGQAEIRRYTNEVGGVPERVSTDLNVNTGDSLPKIHGIISAISNVRDKVVHITTVFERKNIDINRAYGGLVTGPGGPREDAIPAMISNGEYVVQTAAVQKYGVGFFDKLNAMHYAGGGYAGRTAERPVSGGGTTTVVHHHVHEIRLKGEMDFARARGQIREEIVHLSANQIDQHETFKAQQYG